MKGATRKHNPCFVRAGLHTVKMNYSSSKPRTTTFRAVLFGPSAIGFFFFHCFRYHFPPPTPNLMMIQCGGPWLIYCYVIWDAHWTRRSNTNIKLLASTKWLCVINPARKGQSPPSVPPYLPSLVSKEKKRRLRTRYSMIIYKFLPHFCWRHYVYIIIIGFSLVIILIRRQPFFIRIFHTILYFFIFWTVFCSILFGMKGRESDFPTYPLHYYII